MKLPKLTSETRDLLTVVAVYGALFAFFACTGCGALSGLFGSQPAVDQAAPALTPEDAKSIGGILITVGSFFGPVGGAFAAAAAAGLGVYAGMKKKPVAPATTPPPAV